MNADAQSKFLSVRVLASGVVAFFASGVEAFYDVMLVQNMGTHRTIVL
jgi:hypothetical protein